MGCSFKKTKPGASHNQPADWVNVFVGTGGHGHTYPGATVPFGMVQVSPDNGKTGWDYRSGYYGSHQIAGFSMMHLNGNRLSAKVLKEDISSVSKKTTQF